VFVAATTMAGCGNQPTLPTPAPLVGDGKQLIYSALPPDLKTWEVGGRGVNGTEGCVAAIRGTLTLLDAARAIVVTLAVAPRDAAPVRPHGFFEYSGCCVTTAQLETARVYDVQFDSYLSLACP
jgi:hypothetical protein